jgi:DtxR family manganese transport transcriptional regulator
MTKKDKKTRSLPFKAARQQNSEEAAEDYVELVFDLIESRGEARTCTIAEHLGISHVTALRTIRRLQTEGFLQTSPHKPVVLTPKGKKLAQFSKFRHEVLLDFFQLLGVPKAQAEIDVEGAEHHISAKTLSCIEQFLKQSKE